MFLPFPVQKGVHATLTRWCTVVHDLARQSPASLAREEQSLALIVHCAGAIGKRVCRRQPAQVDSDIVWQPRNVSANMMECPDLFPLGDKWVLIGSLYKTNQWWVGTLAGNPPRFTPDQVGILDYGNGYVILRAPSRAMGKISILCT